MKRLLTWLTLALALSWCAPANALVLILRVRGHNVVALSSCAGDGLAGAPHGAAQHPTLLNGLIFRPGCAVAGVDYRVGPPDNITFKQPGDAGALPAAFTWDATTHQAACYGPDPGLDNGAMDNTDKVIDGVDFATIGASIYITFGCGHVTIKNSKIRSFWALHGTNAGACAGPLAQTEHQVEIHLIADEFDGNGATGSTNCGVVGQAGETIQLSGGGVKELDYLWIHDFDQHAITDGGPQPGYTFTTTSQMSVKHSLTERCGNDQGAHCNYLQMTGAQGSLDYEWNTQFDPQPDVSWTTEAGEAAYTSGSAQVVLTLNLYTQSSFRIGQTITGTGLTGSAIICNATSTNPNGSQNTPVITTLTLGTDTTCATPKTASSTVNGTATVPNMWPIGGVIGVRCVNEDADPSVHPITNCTVSHNTFAGPGPIKGMTTIVSCAGIMGHFQGDANYWDARNAAGLFRIDTHCTDRAGSANVEMGTGNVSSVP